MNYSFDYFLYCYSNTVFCAPYHSTIPKDLPCCIPKPIYAFIIGQIMIFCWLCIIVKSQKLPNVKVSLQVGLQVE